MWFSEKVFSGSVAAYVKGVADAQQAQCDTLVIEVEEWVREQA